MNKIRNTVIILAAILFFSQTAALVYFIRRGQELSVRLRNVQPGMEQLGGELADLRKKHDDLTRDHEAMKEDRENLLAQIKALLPERNKSAELAASLDKAAADLAETRKMNESLKNVQTDLQEKNTAFGSSLAHMTKERDDLKILYEKARKEHIVEDLKSEVAQLQKEKSGVENRLRQSEAGAAQLKNQMDKLKADNEELNVQLKN